MQREVMEYKAADLGGMLHKIGSLYGRTAHPVADPMLMSPGYPWWGVTGAVLVLLVVYAPFYLTISWSYSGFLTYIPEYSDGS